jgi:hybrid polyketide synthase/nonribosomal peptide synthetase ACE1
MALEAAQKTASGREVSFYEIHDLSIDKAITFEDDPSFAVETLVTMTDVSLVKDRALTASFSCYSRPNTTSAGDLKIAASGGIRIIFGTESSAILSSTRLEVSHMSDLDTDRFYSSLSELGYGYSGPFRGLSSLKRHFRQGSALLSTYRYEELDSLLMVHPTWLDAAFQATFLALSAPGDQALWSLHIPKSIELIRVNPRLCASLPGTGTELPIDVVLRLSDESISITSDVDIYSGTYQETMVQVAGLKLVPFSSASAANDRRLFSKTEWGLAVPSGPEVVGEDRASREELELSEVCERLSYFYLRKWAAELTEEEWASGEEHHRRLQEYVHQTVATITSGKHRSVKKAWENDSPEDIKELVSK